MTCLSLVRSTSAIAWELRGAWGRGLRVSLAIGGDTRRVEGFVESVSPTDASATISGLLVPLDVVLAVYRPSLLGDSSYDGRGEWSGESPSILRVDPRQMQLPGF